MDHENLIELINNQRKSKGFYCTSELLKLCEMGNTILDPFSTLISESVDIGVGNIFYPCTTLEVRHSGLISIGNDNIFYSQSFLFAENGKITIGSNNQFGDGGFSIKANFKNSEIIIGDNGRYLNGVQLLGKTNLGSGSQVIGNITAQDCNLSSGESFLYPDFNLRGGVLKGFGLARNITVNQGKVLNGEGNFNQSDMKDQSFYHKK